MEQLAANEHLLLGAVIVGAILLGWLVFAVLFKRKPARPVGDKPLTTPTPTPRPAAESLTEPMPLEEHERRKSDTDFQPPSSDAADVPAPAGEKKKEKTQPDRAARRLPPDAPVGRLRIEGKGQSRPRRIDRVPFHIGSDAARSDLVLSGSEIQARHAAITLEDDTFVLTACAADCEVRVNRDRQRRVALRDGDEITIAGTRFRFEEDASV